MEREHGARAPADPSATRPTQTFRPAENAGAASWTIPVHISVSIGQASSPSISTPAKEPVSEAEAEEAVVIDQDYSTRTGYDPHFLEDIDVSLPKISRQMESDTAQVQAGARRNGDPHELAYYHYSVYMNKRRRTA